MLTLLLNTHTHKKKKDAGTASLCLGVACKSACLCVRVEVGLCFSSVVHVPSLERGRGACALSSLSYCPLSVFFSSFSHCFSVFHF